MFFLLTFPLKAIESCKGAIDIAECRSVSMAAAEHPGTPDSPVSLTLLSEGSNTQLLQQRMSTVFPFQRKICFSNALFVLNVSGQRVLNGL